MNAIDNNDPLLAQRYCQLVGSAVTLDEPRITCVSRLNSLNYVIHHYAKHSSNALYIIDIVHLYLMSDIPVHEAINVATAKPYGCNSRHHKTVIVTSMRILMTLRYKLPIS